jgi:hypothetical protein
MGSDGTSGAEPGEGDLQLLQKVEASLFLCGKDVILSLKVAYCKYNL